MLLPIFLRKAVTTLTCAAAAIVHIEGRLPSLSPHVVKREEASVEQKALGRKRNKELRRDDDDNNNNNDRRVEQVRVSISSCHPSKWTPSSLLLKCCGAVWLWWNAGSTKPMNLRFTHISAFWGHSDCASGVLCVVVVLASNELKSVISKVK